MLLTDKKIEDKSLFCLQKLGIQYPESGMRDVEFRIQDCLGFPNMRRVFREGDRK